MDSAPLSWIPSPPAGANKKSPRLLKPAAFELCGKGRSTGQRRMFLVRI